MVVQQKKCPASGEENRPQLQTTSHFLDNLRLVTAVSFFVNHKGQIRQQPPASLPAPYPACQEAQRCQQDRLPHLWAPVENQSVGLLVQKLVSPCRTLLWAPQGPL